MKRFEHKIVKAKPKSKWMGQIDVDSNEDILIGLGLDGWELVSIHNQSNSSGITESLFFLKREIPQEDMV